VIDKVRTQEARKLKENGYEPILTKTRWQLLKWSKDFTEKQEIKLAYLLQYDLKSIRSYLLIEKFQLFRAYSSAYWGVNF
jgi:transposase